MRKSFVNRLRKIEQINGTEKTIVVYMWTPGGKDGPTERRRIHIKASNKGECLEQINR